jgi:hypothetical protein
VPETEERNFAAGAEGKYPAAPAPQILGVHRLGVHRLEGFREYSERQEPST